MQDHMPEIDQKDTHALGIAVSLGVTMVVVLIVCIGGGVWLDSKQDSAPLWTLIGVAIGLIAAGYQLYELMLVGRNDKENGPLGRSVSKAFSRKS